MMKTARSKAIRAPSKTKAPRLSRAAAKAVDDKYYGREPTDVSVRGIVDALNWYNYMYEPEDTHPWLLHYMKVNNYSKEDIASVRRLSKHDLPRTLCTLARILTNGNIVPDETLNNFKTSLGELIARGTKSVTRHTAAKPPEPIPSIQERAAAKQERVIAECEEAIDTINNFDMYLWLQGHGITSQTAVAVKAFYSRGVIDLEYVDPLETKSLRLVREKRLAFWRQLVTDCDRYISNLKVTRVRKPRAKKTLSAVDLVKNLKYQKQDPTLKLVSINPSEIIGVQQLWTYNTKTKKLTLFNALGPAGIQVKGTTLTGFDVESSISKSLRKPDGTIRLLLGAGKLALRKIMPDLKTVGSKPSGRINEDTILLRTAK